jgi:hypothetical protein
MQYFSILWTSLPLASRVQGLSKSKATVHHNFEHKEMLENQRDLWEGSGLNSNSVSPGVHASSGSITLSFLSSKSTRTTCWKPPKWLRKIFHYPYHHLHFLSNKKQKLVSAKTHENTFAFTIKSSVIASFAFHDVTDLKRMCLGSHFLNSVQD